MDFQAIAAVLEFIFLSERARRQLARLAHRHEAGAQRARQRRAEDEAARFDAQHRLERHAAPGFGHRIDRGGIAVRVGEQRGDVLEHYAWLREIRSEEHTSELQSLMRISYAVFCLKKKKKI